MENIYNRRKIADEVYFTSVTDPKFKINRVSVSFITRLSKDAAVNAVIPRLLTKCSAELDTMTKLNRRLAELYSASLIGNVWADGDNQVIDMSVSVLGNGYALDGEDILREAAGILLGCIFRPCLENGEFPAQSLEVEKQNLKDDNDAEINNKTQYAFLRAYEQAFRGEPAEIRWGGTNDEVDAITPASAMSAYKRMLSEMHVEVICAGESDFSGLAEIFAEAFGKTERKPVPLERTVPSTAKPEPYRFTETMDIEQSKLVMFFKTPLREIYTLKVMQNLYGGTESSKLFQNVREKQSLCYYCYSRTAYGKGYITAESGVDSANLGKVEAECLNQLESMRNGEFTEDEITKVKLFLCNVLRAGLDTVGGVIMKCFSGIMIPEYAITVDEMSEKINAVTREDIIRAAKSLTLDTVFVMKSEKEAAE